MLQTVRSTRGMAVAPHALAAQSAVSVLRDGGNAIEAMVAAAATIAVVYPHMNGIGGDGFWMISCPDAPVVAIEACGPAATEASHDYYGIRACKSIPTRGPDSANTVAGTIGGWNEALAISTSWGGRLPPAPARRRDLLCRGRHRGHGLAEGQHRGQAPRARTSARLH